MGSLLGDWGWSDIKGAASLIGDIGSAVGSIKSANVAKEALATTNKMYNDQVQKLKNVKLSIDGATKNVFGLAKNKNKKDTEDTPTIFLNK